MNLTRTTPYSDGSFAFMRVLLQKKLLPVQQELKISERFFFLHLNLKVLNQ